MSKHVDLIAISALLVGFAFAARVQDITHTGIIRQTRTLQVCPLNRIVVVLRHAPKPPRPPAFPRVSY